MIERTSEEFDRKAFGLAFVKRATGISSGLRKLEDWALWRGRTLQNGRKTYCSVSVRRAGYVEVPATPEVTTHRRKEKIRRNPLDDSEYLE
jgi:hypothetical protein